MSPSDLIMLLALGLVFAPLESLRPVRRAPVDRRRLWTDTLHIFLSGTLIRWGSAAVLAGLAFGASFVGPKWLGAQVRAQPVWLQFAEILLLSDLAFYWAHRLCHAVPALWRFHQVHHSSEKLDWIAAHRVHPVDQIFNGAIIAVPAILFGFSPAPLVVYALIYRWHATFLHSNVRAEFGPLKWLIASPRYHHWHHADQVDAYDRNFGGQLVIFDWLFGTLNLPGDRMPEKYGLGEPIATTYLGQLAHPFRKRASGAIRDERSSATQAA
jgi:sterol desaturase/sphingolipid hydroxylase (fatty acid hydroxylase superfamily)